MADQAPMSGYVRCGVTYTEVEWTFEVLSDMPKVALAIIETRDGPLHIGLNRAEAKSLERKLQLFLLDWPEGPAA